MDDSKDQKPFWTTLPGLLTAITGLITAIAALFGSIVGLATVGLIPSQTSEPIPHSQETCEFNSQLSFTTGHGYVSTGTQVTIDNGKDSHLVIGHFTVNGGVDEGGEVRIAYAVDGGAPQVNVYGLANLTNHSEYWEIDTTFAVFRLGPGEHTIEPFVYIGVGDEKTNLFSATLLFCTGANEVDRERFS
jgi:hypothetical protein